jgi:hypothetical protein
LKKCRFEKQLRMSPISHLNYSMILASEFRAQNQFSSLVWFRCQIVRDPRLLFAIAVAPVAVSSHSLHLRRLFLSIKPDRAGLYFQRG